MIDVRLVPHDDTRVLLPVLKPGLEQVIGTVEGLHSVDTEMRAYGQGYYALWLIMRDGLFTGFAGTYPYQLEQRRFLHVQHLYLNRDTPKEAIQTVIDKLTQHASSLGCKCLTFRTSRNPKVWQRRLKETGFKPHLTEFILELE